jgi:hypothetical protein
MVQGSAVPTLSYSLAGFVNGDTAASSVTGTPILSTTATSASTPGAYPISIAIGTLASANYHITTAPGTLTVTQYSQTPLTVTMHNASRNYGSGNPTFIDSITGLKGTDTVTVTPQTTATVVSPAGNYPITATVSGPLAYKYTVTVVPATLTVRKAPLTIVAASENSTYGHTPAAPTAYSLTGFLNGDTASVVTGAPTLSTTVTAATPVGSYYIQVGAGTLIAANYSFVPDIHGGIVRVGKAPLTVKANNLTMPFGGPIPTLTYSFLGFVNGDTAATAVTGAPGIHTTVTTHTKPGNYPIGANIGTLKSANYAITAANGVLTVTP